MNSITLEIEVPEATRRWIVNLKDKPELGRRLCKTMNRQNELTVRRIRQKLTGDVLNVQTGLLHKSIGRTNAVQTGDRVESTVGSGSAFGGASVAYAAFWEFGFSGEEQVRAHMSHRSSRRSFSFGGKTVSRKLHGGDFLVKGYTRKVNQAPRSYIGSTIADRAPDFAADITKTTDEMIGGKPA